MAQALDNEILKYLPLLGNEEKKSLLSVIKSFLSLKNDSESLSIEQYNAEIRESEAEYEKGNYITHDAMKKKVEQWQKNAAK